MHFNTSPQRLLADLRWAVTSEDMMQLAKLPEASNLLSVSDSPVAGLLNHWLQSTDHIAALSGLLKTRQPHRLGIYFEVLWQYVLQHYPGFDLIHRNLPVLSGKQTLGEMDFIYFCRHRQRYIHLETAVKFYLGLPGEKIVRSSAWHRWIGPGRKDRLDLKLNKMLKKQIPLSRTSQGINTLLRLGVTDVLQEICLKGYFFYPLADNCQTPRHCHTQHAQGYWLKQRALTAKLHPGRWHIMQKEEWLSPVILPETHALLDTRQLEEITRLSLSEHSFPIMVARMKSLHGSLHESCRYFITPDNWPLS